MFPFLHYLLQVYVRWHQHVSFVDQICFWYQNHIHLKYFTILLFGRSVNLFRSSTPIHKSISFIEMSKQPTCSISINKQLSLEHSLWFKEKFVTNSRTRFYFPNIIGFIPSSYIPNWEYSSEKIIFLLKFIVSLLESLLSSKIASFYI